MEKKEFSGEYLAPKVKVVKMQPRQMLAGSNFNDSSSDGYENTDYAW